MTKIRHIAIAWSMIVGIFILSLTFDFYLELNYNAMHSIQEKIEKCLRKQIPWWYINIYLHEIMRYLNIQSLFAGMLIDNTWQVWKVIFQLKYCVFSSLQSRALEPDILLSEDGRHKGSAYCSLALPITASSSSPQVAATNPAHYHGNAQTNYSEGNLVTPLLFSSEH